MVSAFSAASLDARNLWKYHHPYFVIFTMAQNTLLNDKYWFQPWYHIWITNVCKEMVQWYALVSTLSEHCLDLVFFLYLLERCWFILARGATPSIAMYSSLRGRIMLKIRSIYSKMATIISSSFRGAGLFSGWQHGWMIPENSDIHVMENMLK